MEKEGREGTSKNVAIVRAKEESPWQSLFVFCVFLSSTIVCLCVFLRKNTRELREEEEQAALWEEAPTQVRTIQGSYNKLAYSKVLTRIPRKKKVLTSEYMCMLLKVAILK